MPKLLVTNHLVMVDGHLIPATQVHIDIDANNAVAHVQIVMDVAVGDLKINLQDADIKLINDENPREGRG